MKQSFKITTSDIQVQQENALDLFKAGIKTKATFDTMNRNLRKFLVEICQDILKGTYKERAQQFVDLTKDEQQKATQIVLTYVRHLKDRSLLELSDPDYLNPSSIPNKIKPIKKLLTMNGLGIGWDRIRATMPSLDNINEGDCYSIPQLQKMLEYSDSIQTDFIICAMSSGGFRVGAWDGQIWGNVFPIYEIDGKYQIEKPESDSKVVCAGIKIYKGSTENYVALISQEAWEKLQEHKLSWIKKVGREPLDSDPLLLAKYTKPIPLSSTAIKEKINKLLITSGIRSPLTEGKRRHLIPAMNGFRRFYNKTMMNAERHNNKLSSLAIKERLMGHWGIVKTDRNYFWTDMMELVPVYLEAMHELIINDSKRLEARLEEQERIKEELEKQNKDKDIALSKMKELEAKVERMTRYRTTS